MRRAFLTTVAILTTAPVSAAQEVVSFPAPDGGVVYAHRYGIEDHTVVLAHGGQFSKESWSEQADALVAAGLGVLAIDFRGRGLSVAGPDAGPGDEDAHYDVMAAVQYLRESGVSRISVVGGSFGGWAAARAAVELPAGAIQNVVLLAAGSIDHPEAIQGRKLFITTRDDFQGSGTLRLPAIRDQFERATEPKELVILEGSAHAQHAFRTEQGPRMLAEILDFLLER